MTLPIWVYFVVAGIFVSAFMALKTAKEDREIEQEWIEKEGRVFIDRMEEERKRRSGMEETGDI